MGCILSLMPGTADQTREEVLLAAADAGFAVTGDQLARWHRTGLVPRPRQQSLGRGLGTVTVYPPGTTDQVIALCRIRTRHRSLAQAAFQLWWDGFGVDPGQVRGPLQAAAAKVDEDLASMASGQGTVPIRFGGTADRRLGRQRRQKIEATIRNASQDTMQRGTPWAELERLPMPPSLDDFLELLVPVLVRTLAGTKAVELVNQTTFGDLCAARDEAKSVLDAITRWVEPMAWLWGQRGTAFQFVADIPKSVKPADLPVLLFTFLLVQQIVPPEIRGLLTAAPPPGLREIAAFKAVHDRVPGADNVITPGAVRALLRDNEAARRHRPKIETFVQEHEAEIRSALQVEPPLASDASEPDSTPDGPGT
jgi:hypothetical protein